MATITLKDAKAGFSALVDKASAGEFVTITRHGKPAAVLVSVDAAEAAKRAYRKGDGSFADHILAFPDIDEDVFKRNCSPARDVEL
ncbi:prevent-host-death family protein [Neorhizobium huautlense]|uniref:Antitoxin n=1 Tax=Neorhizobium huautlense TaxID=67774 RepID=A0ABT9PQS6_9HYPH|nr:type II toxin-antitoxin system Phd/YefM family antitoxin [Neorhizobium huautlense]MDP9836822.1 prevent-host-death family protein [Neorhizobium huautlense]